MPTSPHNQILYTTRIDGTAFTVSVNETTRKKLTVAFAGDDLSRRGRLLYAFMMNHYTNNGYDMKSENIANIGGEQVITFEPLSRTLTPDGRTVLAEANPRAAAEEMIDRLRELESISQAYSLYTGKDMHFEQALGVLEKRHPAPPAEIPPRDRDIQRRTTNNVPAGEIEGILAAAVADTALDRHLPNGSADLKAFVENLSTALKKDPALRGGKSKASDHALRQATRRALHEALDSFGASDAQQAEDAVMSEFIRQMHDAKRRYSPFKR